MQKSYEPEDQDHASPKGVPATAPAALADTPPSWPTILRRRSSIEDDINTSITTSSAPKETSLASTIPPLPISSRESSIDTVLTHQSLSKTPEISSAYVNPTNVWDKKEAVKDFDEHTESIIEEKLSGIEETHADEVKINDDRKEADLDKPSKPSLAADENSLSLEKEAEGTIDQQTDLNYSDDFTCNISTPSETPSSDTNIITVSPTKSLTIKRDQQVEEPSIHEEKPKDVKVDDIDDRKDAPGQHQTLKGSKQDSVKSDILLTKASSEQKPELRGKTVDSICEQLMNDLVKDTYDSLKESINKTKSKGYQEQAKFENKDHIVNEFDRSLDKATSQEPTSSEENFKVKDVDKSETTKPKSVSSHAKERRSSKDGLSKSRPQDMMLTFDLSSESSSEGIFSFQSIFFK